MSLAGQLGTESVKSLGPGAYLVTALPSAVLVTAVFTIATANIYPWSHPPDGIGRGFDSVVAAAKDLGVAGGLVLLVAVILTAVLLRPMQIAAVQLLEGYWGSRGRYGVVQSLAVERHLRRFGRAFARRHWRSHAEYILWPAPDQVHFAAAVWVGRRQHSVERRMSRAGEIISDYPLYTDLLLPTLLGNVLRRAETTSGERYYLDTIRTYPRLYPFLHERIHTNIGTQLNLLDTSAAFTIVFWALAIVALPMAWLPPAGFLLPIGLALLGSLAYAGAVATARDHSTLLAVAYDLHRFDMLAGMRVPLPRTPEEERHTNTRISNFLVEAERRLTQDDRPAIAERYEHSTATFEQDRQAGPGYTGAVGGGGSGDDGRGGDSGGSGGDEAGSDEGDGDEGDVGGVGDAGDAGDAPTSTCGADGSGARGG